MSDINKVKEDIIKAGHKAVQELILVAQEKIITNTDEDLSADKLKSAAATKKLAIFDAFEILNRIQLEKDKLNGEETKQDSGFHSFVEGRTKKA